MALIEEKNISNKSQIGIWNLIESELDLMNQANLLGISLKGLDQFVNENRRRQWLAVRLLLHNNLKEAYSDIYYDEFGKPHVLDHSVHISISHSNDLIAVMIDKDEPIGIDIEYISPRVKKIEKRFLNNVESDFVNRNYETEHLLVLWGAKEALYKRYGKKEIIFKDHLLIQPFEYEEQGTFKAVVKNTNYHKNFELKYEKFQDYMLVYILNG